MKKMKLELHELQVESFEVLSSDLAASTIRGYQIGDPMAQMADTETCKASCMTCGTDVCGTCGVSCSCEGTCGETCPGGACSPNTE